MNTAHIVTYTPAHHADLLRLLLELQDNYFRESASAEKQELDAEKNIVASYGRYVDMLNKTSDGTWQVFMAMNNEGEAIGFIIGSIEEDEDMVLGKTGILEDWLVMLQYRNTGTGAALYAALEEWFRAQGCQQVRSDTWAGNELSIKAHQQLGFFISGVQFGKKL